MATSNSPRDHAADANPELSRKRLRYSGGTEDDSTMTRKKDRSPSLGGDDDDDVTVQVVDDSSDESIDQPSVRILPDGNASISIMHTWTEHRWRNLTPVQQLQRMNGELQKEKYVDHLSLSTVRTFLETYNSLVTGSGFHGVDSTFYLQEEPFFGELARYSLAILTTSDDLFDTDLTDNNSLRILALEFTFHLTRLSVQIVRSLPYITKEKLSRRDSAQGHFVPGSQHMVLWGYAEITAQLLYTDTPAFRFMQQYLNVSLEALQKHCRAEILEHEEPFSALSTAFVNISRAAKEVNNGWAAVAAIMAIVSAFDGVPLSSLGAMLRSIGESVLPITSEQHPRTLAPGFHERILTSTFRAIYEFASMADSVQAARLYKSFIRSETDAVLPEGVEEEDIEAALQSASQHDPRILASLLSLAWFLQATLRYIHSSIMMIRSTGMSLLHNRLLLVFNEYNNSSAGLEHPIPSYAARFLRVNELTKYIFSADSHASLVAQSQEIICFLGVSNTYTNQETDIIWTACMTSVEAEFVKMSFNVLQSVCKFVNVEHLLHIANLYRDTPPVQFSAGTIEFLPELFSMIRDGCDELRADQKLATSQIALDILYHTADAPSPSSNHLALAKIAMNELAVYASWSSEDRLEILQRCVPLLKDRAPQATVVAELLSLFLERKCPASEASTILDMIPLSELVDELGHYSHKASQNGLAIANILMAITARLSVIVHLSAHMPLSDNHMTEDLLFEHVFGSLALNNDARDAALRRLAQLAKEKVGKAPQLLDRYLNEFAPQVSADHVTPALIELAMEPLMGCMTVDVLQSTTAQILGHPLWLTLLNVAKTAPELFTARGAIDALCHLLFVFSQRFVRDSLASVIRIQQAFAHQILESISHDYADLRQFDKLQTQQEFLRRIDILEAVLRTSRNTSGAFSTRQHESNLNLRSPGVKSESWSFACVIHFAQCEPRSLTVHVNDDTALTDLLNALPTYTSASIHRVIVGGQPLQYGPKDQRSLREVGIQPAAHVLISPRYDDSCDIDEVIAVDIPIHKVIREEYDRLEKYVDGPPLVAERAFMLLRNVSAPASARAKVSMAGVQHQDVLPKDRPWRTMHSLQVMRGHLMASVRLGAIDAPFMMHSVQLLTTFMVDCASDDPLDLSKEVMTSLLWFLREQPSTGASATASLSAKQPALVRFLSTMLQQSNPSMRKHTSPARNVQRAVLVTNAYECLLQLSRQDDAFWSDLEEDQSLRAVIPGLLLDQERSVSDDVASLTMRYLQQDTSNARRIAYYWSIIFRALDRALQCPSACEPFFRTAAQVLESHESLDEAETELVLHSIVQHLDRYRHSEQIDLPFTDMVMLGLLRMLEVTVKKLHAHGSTKPLDYIATTIFKNLLCPVDELASEYHPLLYPNARAVALNIVKMTCGSSKDFAELVRVSQKALLVLSAEDVYKDYPGHDKFLRSANVNAGLTNLGMTCYMNSLLQQLFGNLLFRNFILGLAIKDADRQNVLMQIQQLFVQMQDSAVPCIDTTHFAKSLNVEVDSQEDVHGFFTILISILEESMPDEAAKLTLTNFFSGKFTSQIKGQCGHVSTRVDPFNDISITVRNKCGLHESLDEFVQGEPMQGSNKYKCLTCDPENGGRLVNAMKRTCLSEVPDSLTFCLKRFTWEGGYDDKVNDRFEFPVEIDMSVYSQQHLEDPNSSCPDIFELAGVIVHQGTLSFGHYWSYVRTGSANNPFAQKWACLEDCRTKRVEGGVSEVQEECFGGLKWTNGHERTDNAYVLIYQRRASARAHAEVIQRPCAQTNLLENLLPRVTTPARLAEDTRIASKRRWRLAHLFHDDFARFLIWAFSSTKKFVTLIEQEAEEDSHAAVIELVTPVSQLAAKSLLRMVLNNPGWEGLMQKFLSSLYTMRSSHQQSTVTFLRSLTDDRCAWSNIWTHSNGILRAMLSTFVLKSLKQLRDDESIHYQQCLRSVFDVQRMLYGTILAGFAQKWSHYFNFLATISSWGTHENKAVLDNFDIPFLFDLMRGACCPDAKDRQWLALRKLRRNDCLDLRPIFAYLTQVLQNIDLGNVEQNSCPNNGPRTITSAGVCLREDEIAALSSIVPHSQGNACDLVFFGYQCDADLDKWQEYAPGRLMALLVGEKDTSGQWGSFILARLGQIVRGGTNDLNRILCLSLHFCATRGDKRGTVQLVKDIVETVQDWQRAERQGLRFVEECYLYAPVAIVESVIVWAPDYIFMKDPIGTSTMQFLNDHVLQSPKDEPNELDMTRLACVRKLIPSLLERMQKASGHDLARSTFECANQVVRQARLYLQEIAQKSKEWSMSGSESGFGYSAQAKMRIQLDEAASTRQDLDELSRLLDEWMLESSASTSDVDVIDNRPVEEDALPEDEEELDEDEVYDSDEREDCYDDE